MRHLVVSALLVGLMASSAHAEASNRSLWRMAQNAGSESGDPGIAETDRAASPPVATPPAPAEASPPPAAAMAKDAPTSANATAAICKTIESAALVNELPLGFFTRLIWQESRFNVLAVSRAGAQGIAQFMPKTALWVGLANPFDADGAINKSAEFLHKLKGQFGNLGLAAAAYNAGPKRVQDWLAGRRSLPRETQAYVRIVTGHAAGEWTPSDASRPSLSLPEAVPCPEIATLFASNKMETPRAGTGEDKPKPMPGPAEPAWGVQLIGNSSQVAALASYYQLQKTYKSVLGARQPLVVRSPVGRNAYWYRVRIGANSRGDAEKLCSSLRAVGGSCLVQLN